MKRANSTTNHQLPAAKSPLVVIVGETASGKSALAIEIAKKFNGEMICADSRTVYKGMDIGTAKPTKEDRLAVPHHLLDLVDPDQRFTSADFKELAQKAINNVGSRGKLPILVGGTGLYIDSVLFDFDFAGPADLKKRASLNTMSIEQLQKELNNRQIPLPENTKNKRYLIRTLEKAGEVGQSKPLRKDTLIIAIKLDKKVLEKRVNDRIDIMVRQGLVKETNDLVNKYGLVIDSMQTPGYKAFWRYLQKEITLGEAKKIFAQNDMKLAKRQRTWFRSSRYDALPDSGSPFLVKKVSDSIDVPMSMPHSPKTVLTQKSSSLNKPTHQSTRTKRNKSIHWVGNKIQAVDLVTTFLNT